MLARRFGIQPSEFWNMTPWHLSLAARAHGREAEDAMTRVVAGAWHTANLSRGKPIALTTYLQRVFTKVKKVATSGAKKPVSVADQIRAMWGPGKQEPPPEPSQQPKEPA